MYCLGSISSLVCALLAICQGWIFINQINVFCSKTLPSNKFFFFFQNISPERVLSWTKVLSSERHCSWGEVRGKLQPWGGEVGGGRGVLQWVKTYLGRKTRAKWEKAQT
jgi:hypothetical protein